MTRIFLALLAILTGGTNTRASLISYWNFSEASGSVAHNQVAGDPDGTLLGGAHFVQNTGILGGRSIQFDHATNDLVDFGNNFNFPTGSFSIVVWVKIAAGDTTPMIPVSKNETTGAKNGYLLGVGKVLSGQTNPQDGKVQFIETGFSSGQTSTLVNDNNWHMIVGYYDSDSKSAGIEVVGGPSGGTLLAPTMVTNVRSLLLGGITQSGVDVNQYAGFMDEFRVYDEVLTPDKTAAIYQSSLPEPEPAALLVLLIPMVLRHVRVRRSLQ